MMRSSLTVCFHIGRGVQVSPCAPHPAFLCLSLIVAVTCSLSALRCPVIKTEPPPRQSTRLMKDNTCICRVAVEKLYVATATYSFSIHFKLITEIYYYITLYVGIAELHVNSFLHFFLTITIS